MSDTQPHDAETGEILAPTRNPYALRSLQALLSNVRNAGGETAAAITQDALDAVAAALEAAMAKERVINAAITLKLSFKNDPNNEIISIWADVKTTLPPPAKPVGGVYLDGRGGLSAIHPRQMDLGLRAVAGTAAPIRSAGVPNAEIRPTPAGPDIRTAG